MSRVKRGKATRKRHKRVLKQAKGFFGLRKNVFSRAKETILRAMAFAFRGRKQKKRNYRSLFITRVNAACSLHGVPYNKFIYGLKQMDVHLNRKMLSQLAIFEPDAFAQLVTMTKHS